MLSGKELQSARTLGTMYDHNCIKLISKDGNEYRISADVILEALKHFSFSKQKARVHTYLTLV